MAIATWAGTLSGAPETAPDALVVSRTAPPRAKATAVETAMRRRLDVMRDREEAGIVVFLSDEGEVA